MAFPSLMPDPALPYFDRVLQRLAAGDPQLERCFGKHVHWGYWTDPTHLDGLPFRSFRRPLKP